MFQMMVIMYLDIPFVPLVLRGQKRILYVLVLKGFLIEAKENFVYCRLLCQGTRDLEGDIQKWYPQVFIFAGQRGG